MNTLLERVQTQYTIELRTEKLFQNTLTKVCSLDLSRHITERH